MKSTTLLFGLYGVLCISNASSSSFKWSKSYNLKAVLTVPAANLSEPYEVWMDGDTGSSRVDFYGGMDKLYRQWDAVEKKYYLYKIHPKSTDNLGTKDVCNEVSSNEAYARHAYLPNFPFKFSHKEVINSVEAHKWTYTETVEQKISAKLVHSVWITYDKASPTNAVPVRYVFEWKVGDKVFEYFRHDYSYFDSNKPERSILQKPLGLPCAYLRDTSFYEPIDPLLEFINPRLEHARVTKAFDWFKMKHNKTYADKDEHFKRMNIFKENLRYINSINRQHRSFSLAVNHLADLTDEEMSVFLGTNHMKSYDEDYDASGDYDDIEDGNDIPHAFDWREYGAITPVKDQTSLCGSCYAFTTATAIESTAYIARGCKHLEEVSVQAILECTWASITNPCGNWGCDGGTYEYTLRWVKQWGIPLASEYGPYLAQDGLCHFKNMTKLVTIDAFSRLQKRKRRIKKYIATMGPMLAAIDANLKPFTFYSGGIFSDPRCRTEPDKKTHGVTIVGYGKEEGQEYWILKNSYGVAWGEDGYMRIAIKDNVCGVQNFAMGVSFAKSKIKDCKKVTVE